jgi:DNA binding domain, excisionase family
MLEVSFSLHDASRATGVPTSTLQHFIRNGELPTVKIGRSRVIRRVALDEFLAKYEVRAVEKDEQRTSTLVVHEAMREAQR